MRFLYSILLFLLVCSCQNKPKETSEKVPAVFVPISSPQLSVLSDTVFMNHKKFNGYLFDIHPVTKDTLLLEGYHNGLLSGLCRKWFPNQQLMEERHYKSGRKQGKQIAYWENGHKRFEFVAENDAYEGEVKEYDNKGRLFHLAHYKNGQEEGSQKMWYENGKIKANYVVKNGKRYGLLGTKNCKNVSDSIFVVK